MRIKVDEREMFERAQLVGFIYGKSLRRGDESHFDKWHLYCAESSIACVSLSIGRKRAKAYLDAGTITYGLNFESNAAELRDDLSDQLRYFEAAILSSSLGFTVSSGHDWISVEGISPGEGEWLARRFVDVAGMHYRDLLQLPINVVLLHEHRRRWHERMARRKNGAA